MALDATAKLTALLQLLGELDRFIARFTVKLLPESLDVPRVNPERLRALADRSVTAHQSDERLLMQLVSREHAPIRLCRLRRTFLRRLQRAELHQTVDVHSLKAIAMLEMPIADRFAIE